MRPFGVEGFRVGAFEDGCCYRFPGHRVTIAFSSSTVPCRLAIFICPIHMGSHDSGPLTAASTGCLQSADAEHWSSMLISIPLYLGIRYSRLLVCRPNRDYGGGCPRSLPLVFHR